MSAHTQGKLMVCGGAGVYKFWLLPDSATVEQPGDLIAQVELEADGRRLASCWNACDGLSQDALDGEWTAKGISAYARGLEDRIASLEAMAIVRDAELNRAKVAIATMIDAARGVLRYEESEAGGVDSNPSGELVYIDDVMSALTAASAL